MEGLLSMGPFLILQKTERFSNMSYHLIPPIFRYVDYLVSPMTSQKVTSASANLFLILDILEDMARYAGLILAPAEGRGIFCPLDLLKD